MWVHRMGRPRELVLIFFVVAFKKGWKGKKIEDSNKNSAIEMDGLFFYVFFWFWGVSLDVFLYIRVMRYVFLCVGLIVTHNWTKGQWENSPRRKAG